MGKFIRVFLFSLVCFSLAAFAGITAYSKIFDTKPLPIPQDQVDKLDLDGDDPFDKLVLEGKRLNTLVVGVNDNMTDTIMLASFNVETKQVDIISIPRDTYHHRKGYNGAAQKKINAIYSSQGIETLIVNIQEVLGSKIPIHHYAVVKYEGVEKMVDLVGGVKVNIPMNMKYDDPYDKPPLKIRISKGEQVLKGKEAIQFLRYRKPNKGERGGYPDGDIGRIKAQQDFVKSFIKKSIGLKLPNIIKTGVEHIETDIKMSQGVSYASRLAGIDSENINMIMLPGIDKYIKGTSYYIHDEDATRELIRDIYANRYISEEDLEKKLNEEIDKGKQRKDD